MDWAVLLWQLVTLLPLCYASGNTVPTRTIIDVLSSSPEFSTLLELLQERELIPLINQSWNSTFLAPVNSAFAEVDPDSVSKDLLLYHFLNATVTFDDDWEKDEYLVPSYLKYSKGKESTNINVHIKGASVNNGQADIVDSNLLGSKDRGVVQAISSLLVIPQSLCRAAYDHDEISFFTELMSFDKTCDSIGLDVTLFAPSDNAFKSYNDVQSRYLLSSYAREDRSKLLKRHIYKGVLKPDEIPDVVELLDGFQIYVEDDLTINGNYQPEESWLLASNGIFNIYSTTIGDEIVEFTPEKYIYGLDGYKFAHEVQLYGFESLIDGTETSEQTILVPTSDLASYEKSKFSKSSVPDRAVNDAVLYQFLDEKLVLDDSSGPRLIDTKMRLASGRYNQRVNFMYRSGGTPLLNWRELKKSAYEVGNTTLYSIEGKIPLPPSLAMAVGPLFLSSYSLSFLDELGLLSLPIEDSWTLLLPTRDAWEDQFLLKSYFDQNPQALRKVFNNLILRAPLYSDTESQKVALFDGQKANVTISKLEGSSKTVFGINDELLDTEIVDILFDNGVVHCVNQLPVPANLEIGATDLIESGDRGEFIDLLEAHGLGHVLTSGKNYTIFVPDPAKLKEDNYTVDAKKTRELLSLHILEGNPLANMMAGEVGTTLANEDLKLHHISKNTYSVGPVASGGQRAFISSWANTNGYVSSGTTVLFIDSYISPEWVRDPLLRPPFRIHTNTLVFTGIIIGLLLMSVLIVGGIFFFTDNKNLAEHDPEQNAQYRDDPDDEDDREPSQAIRATHVNEDREFGRHLGLP